MAIDPAQAVGQEYFAGRTEWRQEDVVLYHLALGAGAAPEDEGELAYLGVRPLKIMPTFAVIPTSGVTAHLPGLPGLDYDPAMAVHGDQEIILHGPIPAEANVTNRIHVTDVFDKGRGALIVLDIETRDTAGNLLFTTRRGSFIRGAGGFGGPSGPKAGNHPPERAPDLTVEVSTLPQQALLYDLASGDHNTLHTDPEVARKAGFDKPIIHGLCTYGMVCKAVIDHALEGDPSRVKSYQARFSGPIMPGETLAVAMWREEGRIALEATVKERGTPAVSNAAVVLA